MAHKGNPATLHILQEQPTIVQYTPRQRPPLLCDHISKGPRERKEQ